MPWCLLALCLGAISLLTCCAPVLGGSTPCTLRTRVPSISFTLSSQLLFALAPRPLVRALFQHSLKDIVCVAVSLLDGDQGV